MGKRLFGILLLLCCNGMSYAGESRAVEVTAKEVAGTADTIDAKGGVVVYYEDTVLHADRAHYDKRTHLLTLEGHVETIGFHGSKEQTEYLQIDTRQNHVSFKELFFSNENDIWLVSEEANRSEGNYSFGRSVLSSCDVEDPIWTMRFKKAEYDSQAQYMKLYDAKIYFDDMPIFYTPYLAFSTNSERTSGLLFPIFGYTGNEGFIYEQPIYWAIDESMDLEFNPQIRTDRSVGGYMTFRFADSPNSSGALRIGYFKDRTSYVEENNLPESEHYGLEFLYDASEVISDSFEGYRDGLYANVTLLNDIDYLNLQKTTLEHFGQVPLQESRLNYYITDDTWYGAMYAKYFIDTRLSDNDATIQTLPELQLHRYVDRLFWDNLTYSLDIKTRRLDRREGTTLNQVELRVPVEFTMAFWDDYLNLSLGESLYFGRFFFGNDNTLVHDYFQYNSNVHTAKLFSDLTKRYGSFVHVLQPSLSYVKPGNESQKPVAFERMLTQQPQVRELFSVGLPEEQFSLAINQYVYDEAMHLIFFQRLSQSYYPQRDYAYSELNNEMQFNWNRWRFYNNLHYNYEYDKVSESSSYVTYKDDTYSFGIGHSFKRDMLLAEHNITANDINFDFRYDYSERVAVYGGLTYNLEDHAGTLWHFGTAYKRDCWSVSAQVNADILPRPTDADGNSDATQEYSFMVLFSFIPFASFGSDQP